MQTRPSMVYVRRRCCRRRAMRTWIMFLIFCILLLCCGLSFIWAVILAGALTLAFRLGLCRLP